MKVFYLTYSQSPYRVDFFEELGKMVNLTVCFEITPSEDKEKRNKNWYKKEAKNFKSIFLKNKYIFGRYFSKDAIKILKKEKFDIIVIGSYSSLTSIITMLYLKHENIPFFINVDGGFSKDGEGIIKKKAKEYFLGLGSYYLSSGNNAQKYLEYYGVDKNKIFYYPFTNIREKEKIKKLINEEEKVKIKKDLNIKEKLVFLFIGQFIYRKGIDLLIKASLKLPNDVGVYIIGDKPNKEYLMLTNRNLNIHFIDFQAKDMLKKYFLASDFFVFPTREDIFGLVVVEALSYGLPVLTTNNCGAGLDLIKNDYNGYIIEKDNEEALMKQMTVILKNRKNLQKMKENSLKTVNSYTIEEEAKIHYAVFNDILKRNQK